MEMEDDKQNKLLQMTSAQMLCFPAGTHSLKFVIQIGVDHDISLHPIEVAEGEESDIIQAVIDLDSDDDSDDSDVNLSTTEDNGLASAEVDGMDIINIDINIDAGEAADPIHEAEHPSGDPNILLPADVIMDPQSPSDGCNTPDIDFSFMYQPQASHDLWVTLDEVEEGAGEGDTDIGGLEDSNDELEDDRHINWAKFEVGENGELSAWDQLGAGYNREFASIEQKLVAYDLAICKAFAYKIKTQMTDRDWPMTSFAFLQDPPLPALDELQS
ncbi:hypothetical protein L208DRAFT_1378517 [Tricholoma matsutake]|nr:hypothetical protein L208DRAFT_1378517 [Tricholoma matsutake 945]